MENLLSMAYGIRRDQIVGMPYMQGMFSLQAKADSIVDARLASLNEEKTLLEQQHMLQVLLADRFRLKVHWETRQGVTYNLVLSKGGLKATKAKGQPASSEERKVWGDRPIPHIYQQGDSRSGFVFIARECSMEDLAQTLAGQFGHPVLDKTGLTGRYDFSLRYHGVQQGDRGVDDLDPVPPLDIAIYDQLGLKLDRAKGPVRILAVDHLENLSEN